MVRVRKIEACIRNLEAVAADPAGSRRWGISFVSATGLPEGTPLAFARRVNPVLADWMEQEGGAAAALYSLTLWDSCPVRGWCRF